jgi:hypothetical protein
LERAAKQPIAARKVPVVIRGGMKAEQCRMAANTKLNVNFLRKFIGFLRKGEFWGD